MTGSEFAGGQRWMSEVEPELGLGTVFSCDSRRVTLLFQSNGEVRHYPRREAPLRRIRFRPGNTVRSYEGWSLRVEAVEETRGVLIYRGEGRSLPETELSDISGFRPALDRLLAGPRDTDLWFDLRLESLEHRAWWEGSPLRGLLGGRIALRGEQLQRVQEIARRVEPRVLIADPGSPDLMTEAGLLLHRRLSHQRHGRVLLLAPQAALTDWARVLLHRFQLPFAILDRIHYQVLEASGEENPFASEALVLVAIEWLVAQPRHHLQLLAVDWQTLVVDQIQRLDCQADRPGTDYLLVAELCERIPTVLLLAPGVAGDIPVEDGALLQLLEPEAFAEPSARPAQRQRDRQLVDLARTVCAGEIPDPDSLAVLSAWPGADDLRDALIQPPADAAAREALLAALADRHSTAGLLYRVNSGGAVAPWGSGVPLACPGAYQALADQLYPERDYHGDLPWWQVDPRPAWLIQQCSRSTPLVVICGHAATARELQAALERSGVAAPCLHEQQTPLSRDRAVDRFQVARIEGVAVLVCSAAGIAERVLPAVPHVVLFDLPVAPADLLRRFNALQQMAGQPPSTVSITYLQDTAQAELYGRYQACLAGDDLATLLASTREIHDEAVSWQLTPSGAELQAALEALDQDSRLTDYLARLFQHHGVFSELLDHEVLRLSPAEHPTGSFPGVPDTGTLVTLSRTQALAREEPGFLSWDHPLVGEAMTQLLAGERGNACVVAWRNPDHSPELLLETVHILEYPLADACPAEVFLPPTPIRLVVDADFAEVSELYSRQRIQRNTVALEDRAISALINHHRELVEAMLEVAEVNVQMHCQDLLADIHQRVMDSLEARCQRLEVQQQLNPGAPTRELAATRQWQQQLDDLSAASTLRLDALRLVVGQG